MRRPLPALVAVLAGGFLVLVGAGRTWVVATFGGSALLPPVEVAVTGSDLRPGLVALGLVGLAGVPAVAASRGRSRRGVGALLALAGAGVVALVLQLGLTDPGLVTTALMSEQVQSAGDRRGVAGAATIWPAATAAGGALLLAAGVVVAVRGPGWSALGRRYDSPVAPVPAAPAAPAAERDLWEALDRGQDPTDAQDPPGAAPQARD